MNGCTSSVGVLAADLVGLEISEIPAILVGVCGTACWVLYLPLRNYAFPDLGGRKRGAAKKKT